MACSLLSSSQLVKPISACGFGGLQSGSLESSISHPVCLAAARHGFKQKAAFKPQLMKGVRGGSIHGRTPRTPVVTNFLPAADNVLDSDEPGAVELRRFCYYQTFMLLTELPALAIHLCNSPQLWQTTNGALPGLVIYKNLMAHLCWVGCLAVRTYAICGCSGAKKLNIVAALKSTWVRFKADSAEKPQLLWNAVLIAVLSQGFVALHWWRYALLHPTKPLALVFEVGSFVTGFEINRMGMLLAARRWFGMFQM